MGGSATMAVLERHDAMAAKAAGKLCESDGVDVAAGRGGARDDGEACRGDGAVAQWRSNWEARIPTEAP